VRFLRDPNGGICGVRNECGEIEYKTDESGLTVDIAFGKG
jgi:hypothetical protein